MQQITSHPQPSPADLERFREEARAEWTDALTVEAWRRWHAHLTLMFRPLTEVLLGAADLGPGQRVLDLACGSGEPALTIASRVGVSGHVVATDLSAGMVALAEANARRLALANMSFRDADAEALPFGDGSFDRVTCRLGIMHMTDPLRAQREIFRVLRPGGRVTEVVWGAPERHEPLQSTFGMVLRHVEVPPPEPGAPSAFRFAESGSLSESLRAAGFREVQEERREVRLAWPGAPEEMWRAFLGLVTPLRALVEGLPAAVRAQVEAEVRDALGSRQIDGQIRLAAEIVVGTAVR